MNASKWISPQAPYISHQTFHNFHSYALSGARNWHPHLQHSASFLRSFPFLDISHHFHKPREAEQNGEKCVTCQARFWRELSSRQLRVFREGKARLIMCLLAPVAIPSCFCGYGRHGGPTRLMMSHVSCRNSGGIGVMSFAGASRGLSDNMRGGSIIEQNHSATGHVLN